jgi:hypothetical protein
MENAVSLIVMEKTVGMMVVREAVERVCLLMYAIMESVNVNLIVLEKCVGMMVVREAVERVLILMCA